MKIAKVQVYPIQHSTTLYMDLHRLDTLRSMRKPTDLVLASGRFATCAAVDAAPWACGGARVKEWFLSHRANVDKATKAGHYHFGGRHRWSWGIAILGLLGRLFDPFAQKKCCRRPQISE